MISFSYLSSFLIIYACVAMYDAYEDTDFLTRNTMNRIRITLATPKQNTIQRIQRNTKLFSFHLDGHLNRVVLSLQID